MPSFLPVLPFARRRLDGAWVFDAVTLRWATDVACGAAPPSCLPPGGDRGVLEAAGLATADGQGGISLGADVAALLRRVGEAAQTAQIHRFEGGQEQRASLLDGPEGPVLIEHGSNGTCTLHAVAPADRVATVAGFVGFEASARRTDGWAGGPAAHAVERFHSCLARGDSAAASDVLRETTRWSRGELELLLDLVEGRCHSWRVVHRGRTLTVVDGARRGLWASEVGPGEATQHGFVATTSVRVEQALVALVQPPEPVVQVA